MSLEQGFNQHPCWVKKKKKLAYLGCRQMELLIIGNHLDSPLWSLRTDRRMRLASPLA